MAKHLNGCLLLAVCMLASVSGHSYLTSPISRSNQRQSESGCRGPACLGPCDVPLSSQRTAPVTIARGATINAQWPRNNHAGGFIRFAWAQTASSDSASSFNAGVLEINCHEVGGCKPDDPSDPNGGDSGAGDGSFQPCQWNITVPPHLSDGEWTLQWAWFGGAFALGDYYSCVDYVISGGASGSQPTAVFHGGDYTYPGQPKCKFFNTDRLGECINEPCSNPIYPASQEEAGPAFGVPVAGSGSTTTSSTTTTTTTQNAPVTTHAQPPVTTGAKAPVTTGAKAPVTTGAKAPVTTGANAPVTTGAKAAVTTGANAPVTTGAKSLTTSLIPAPLTTGVVANSGNCAGAINLSTSTVTISSITQWSNVFQMVIYLHVQEPVLKNWMVEVVWPSNADSTEIITTYNGGVVDCQATTPVRHAMIVPVAGWANNLVSGSVLAIEIQASNTNMKSQFIEANTVFRVYTQ